MKSLSLKNKIMAVLAIALCAVIVGFLIYTAVVIVNGVKPKAPVTGGDDTVYDVNFGGNISLLGVDYEVALQGNDGEFTVNAGRISDVTGGTYTFTEGQGYTFTFSDSSGTIVRSQYDADTKSFSFIYHLDMGSRGAGNLLLSCTDEDFVQQGEPWADIPSFQGVGFAGITVVVSCDAENNFRIFATAASPAPVTEVTGSYEFKDGAYVLTTSEGAVYTSVLNADGLHEFVDVPIYVPAISTSMNFTFTQIVLTLD